MPDYRRLYVPGGIVFLTMVTHRRVPLFASAEAVSILRAAVADVRAEWPFEVAGAVVLPDHLHFLWSLPPNDADYSKRAGRFKFLVTKALGLAGRQRGEVSASRQRHRESDVWQRRFWDHGIRDEDDFIAHMDYIHFNPVRHRLVSCPHAWPYSSFGHWVERGAYQHNWGCGCGGAEVHMRDFSDIAARVGE